MSNDLRAEADSNLTNAIGAAGMSDPRPGYRERLRSLKDRDSSAFERALRHYEDVVLPALATGPDPMGAWVQYGQFLAALTAPGRTVSIDGSGRASKLTLPLQPGILVLQIPDDNSAPVFIAAAPASPTPSQRATLDLLAHGRLAFSGETAAP
jgi:hypothetical protein